MAVNFYLLKVSSSKLYLFFEINGVLSMDLVQLGHGIAIA